MFSDQQTFGTKLYGNVKLGEGKQITVPFASALAKKGADKGIDGRLYFHDDPKGPTKQIIFSVKGGDTVHVKELHPSRRESLAFEAGMKGGLFDRI